MNAYRVMLKDGYSLMIYAEELKHNETFYADYLYVNGKIIIAMPHCIGAITLVR